MDDEYIALTVSICFAGSRRFVYRQRQISRHRIRYWRRAVGGIIVGHFVSGGDDITAICCMLFRNLALIRSFILSIQVGPGFFCLIERLPDYASTPVCCSDLSSSVVWLTLSCINCLIFHCRVVLGIFRCGYQHSAGAGQQILRDRVHHGNGRSMG